ncbi:TetR/AcrR family transcriptional regulator [Alkalicoccobacillus gibsonii]|uniref:TetR/AcrR family transcriptional regulator n=1 Tax=Alkalicoccobacillus gibsonii TaxID=79881 RepID=UPI0019325EAD|nr:TetR/AcrR family transcriptional regulator [Alkalicoccobacillus gibsonii]MBM0066130.1 TetR/AcrR family transcriptional regulator [Alkalicoccobacillus gibsonii]
MAEKNKLIIENAIKLFSTNSISSTSIQDIATESGISKGAFYLHFKSKDALVVAIIDYYSDLITSCIQKSDYDDLAPRKQYNQKLTDLFEFIIQHKDFILVQMKDPSIPLTDEMKSSLKRVTYKMTQFHQTYLTEMYGHQIKPFLWDLTLIIDGLFHSYTKFLIHAPVVEIRILVPYILERVDSIVEGLKPDDALLKEEQIAAALSDFFEVDDSISVSATLHEIRNVIRDSEKKDELFISIDMLEEESQKTQPRLPIIQGMLLNLRNEPGIQKLIQRLVTHYQLNDSLFND